MAVVQELIEKARKAQKVWETYDEKEVRSVVLACAAAILDPDHNSLLSREAVSSTGIGKVEDKVLKNERKTLGLLNDLKNAKTFGIVSEDSDRGITEILRPVGVVGAITPSTNPIATPLNNIINAIICRNAIILSPSPKGSPVLGLVLDFIFKEFAKQGLKVPENLIQSLPASSSKEESKQMTDELMKGVDLIVCTGSRNNVRRSYQSGNAALGVGVGNVVVIVDETAALKEAAMKIKASKTFDHATSCSSENNVVVVKSVYDEFMSLLREVGGVVLTPSQAKKLQAELWKDGQLNPHLIAQSAKTILEKVGIVYEGKEREEGEAEFILVEESGIGEQHPFSGEKLSPVLTVYQADDFEDAKKICKRILDYDGRGHSVGIHTGKSERARDLGLEMEACRIIVNQAHCLATGGGMENNLPFSLSMGCGTWGKNSFSENLHYRHFCNTVRVAFPVAKKNFTWEKISQEFL